MSNETILTIRFLLGLPFLVIAIPFILVFQFISGTYITSILTSEDEYD